MKIFNKILAGAGFVAALTLTSCNLTTESSSNMDDQTVFSNETLAEYAVLSIYEVYSFTNCHRGRYLPWYGFNTDIEIYHSLGSANKTDLAQYSSTTTNSNMNLDNGPYASLFTGIERANLAVKNLRAYGDTDGLKALLGEALVARAMIYIELMKAYGEVPARFEPISSETMYLNKSDKDVIYKQILADLEESFDYLTYSTNSTTDRVGLAFAKGLYARAALYASGYSLRPDEGLVGTGDLGTVRLSEDPELQKSVLYPKALAALKDVISNAGLTLEDYETLWRDLNNCDNLTYGSGHETIFVIPFSNSRGRWNYTFAVKHSASDDYIGTATSRGGDVGPVPFVYYWYDDNDVRRDISCVNYSWESTDNGVLPTPSGMLKWYFGKYRFEWMDSNPYTGGNDDGVKPIYMRYADILLMAAEIANSSECGSRDESYAKECLLTVLNRAYTGHESEASAIVNALSGEDNIFEEIKKQRALEFVGEFLRKADLIRWNCLKSSMDAAANELVAIREQTTGPITGRDFSKLGTYLWYYNDVDENGVPTLVTYGNHLGENDSDKDVEPDADHDWQPNYNSSGEISKYLSSTTFISSDYDWADPTVGFYEKNPDANTWWPIPATLITNAQGTLVNDYGF